MTTITTKKPAYLVYTVREGKYDDQSFWTKIGVAFRHNDGKGISVMLDALPTDGRLTIRKYEPKQDQDI